MLSNLLVWIHEVLAQICRIVVPGYQIFDDSKIGEFHAPASPLANFAQAPPLVSGKPLTATSAERMGAVWVGVPADVEQIVSKHFEELFWFLVKCQTRICLKWVALTMGLLESPI